MVWLAFGKAAMPVAKKMNGASQSRRPMNRTPMTKKNFFLDDFFC
jgi:hypothetical protein